MNSLKKYNWLFPVLVLFALSLGTLGFRQYFDEQGTLASWFTCIYLSLQLFVLESGSVVHNLPFLLEVARFLAPAVTASGILLAIWKPFYKNYQLYRIHIWKNHMVVCGLSKKAELLIEDFIRHDKKTRIVLIEPNENHGSLMRMRHQGVIVLSGSGTDEEDLMKANVLHAKYLLALTQDEKVNIQIAQRATRLHHQFPRKTLPDTLLQVILHVDDFYTMNIFKEFHEKDEEERSELLQARGKMDYHVFSIFQLAASYMVDRFSPDQYRDLRSDSDPPAHILILGDTLAAEYLILEAAHMYHFANLKKTRITVVSDDVTHIVRKMEALYPFLKEAVDIQYVTIVHFFSDRCPIDCDELAVSFIALDDDGKSIYFSRKLRQFLFAQHQSKKKHADIPANGVYLTSWMPPIKTLLPRNTALVHIFNDIKAEMKMLNIELLNMDKELCNKKTIVDDRKTEDFIAQHIHYEWEKNHSLMDHKNLGTMEEEWDELKDAQKDSNRLPARHLNIKLRFVNAEFSNQKHGEDWDISELDDKIWDRIGRMEHQRWMAEKYLGGYVQVKDQQNKDFMHFLNLILKCHPDMVPYEDLAREIQEKDMFTFRMAPEIARLNNKRIVRRDET